MMRFRHDITAAYSQEIAKTRDEDNGGVIRLKGASTTEIMAKCYSPRWPSHPFPHDSSGPAGYQRKGYIATYYRILFSI